MASSLLQRLVAGLPVWLRRSLKALPGTRALRDRLYGTPAAIRPQPGTPRPVVYLPTWLEWDVMKQRPQNLLEALARAGHPVWFVDPRLDHAEHRAPGIDLVPTLTDTPESDVILYTHFALTRTLIDRYENPAVVYDILDDLSIYDPDEVGMPTERRVRTHHGPLVARADVVIASSTVLADKHRGERDDILLVENGVDTGLFRPRDDLRAGDPPVIGYHGVIAPWFDFAKVVILARTRPDYRISLVGPVKPEVSEEYERLVRLPNVRHIGHQPAEKVAELVAGFDVGLIPRLLDEVTAGMKPLKMLEYLAAGVPVVATPIAACVAHPGVRTGATPEEFAGEVDAALAMSPEQRRGLRRYAEEESWGRTVAPLLERLDELGLRLVPAS